MRITVALDNGRKTLLREEKESRRIAYTTKSETRFVSQIVVDLDFAATFWDLGPASLLFFSLLLPAV